MKTTIAMLSFALTVVLLPGAGASVASTANPSAHSTSATKIAYSDPSWSHDGRQVVAVGRRPSGETDLFVIKLDGSSRRLDVGPFVRAPTWSNHDRRIAFATSDGISSVRPDGRDLRRVTSNGWTPSWSPGGRKIAFAWGTETSGSRIYVVNPDGSGRRIAAQPAEARSFSNPTWSPDGEQLAFHVAQAPDLGVTLPRFLGVVRDYGGRTTYLLRGFDPAQPAWSPTGAMIAFADHTQRIAILDLRTKLVKRLRLGRSPTWSPNGKKIAFARSGAIFIVNADGSNSARLTR